MRSPRRTADEQYELIMECRSSGLSDQQWCMQHDINPGTFYNWVKRLRKKACYEIPAATGREKLTAPVMQEVVTLHANVQFLYCSGQAAFHNSTQFYSLFLLRMIFEIASVKSP